jgi:hypothetical protein
MKYLYLTILICFYMSDDISAQIFGGSSLLLDGNFDYVAVNDSPELTPLTSTITIETWVKTDSSSLEREIISKYNSSAGVDQISWSLAVRQNSSVGFGVYENFDKWRYVETDSALISADKWYHISATFDISNQESHIYLDGEEVLATLDPGSADSISFISDSNTPVTIGTVTIIDGALTYFWNGNIDEVRVWNIARTKFQIQSTMNDTLTSEYYSTADSGLVAYWRCDVLEDLGINADGPDDIRDFSVFQNHGDLSGDAVLEIVTSVESNNSEIPSSFELEQNYPNPFNPSTTINYSIPASSFVTLKLYDVLGNEIANLVNEEKEAGRYSVEFNATTLPSGIYFYRLQAGSFVETKKMVLMK